MAYFLTRVVGLLVLDMLFRVLLLLCVCCSGLIVQYDEVLSGSTLDWYLVGMYKSQAFLPPGVATPGVGASFIDINVTVTRAGVDKTGHVEVLIFREDQLGYFTINIAYSSFLCCDQEVFRLKQEFGVVFFRILNFFFFRVIPGTVDARSGSLATLL